MRAGWVFTAAPTAAGVVCIMQTDLVFVAVEIDGPELVHDALIALSRHCAKLPAGPRTQPTIH